MHHDLIDRYSDRDSPIHRLDPRTKILCLLLFAIVVVTTPAQRAPCFFAYAVLMAFLVALSRLPIAYLLKRVCLVLPFVVLTAAFLPFRSDPGVSAPTGGILGRSLSGEGARLLASVTTKAVLAATALVLLASSTRLTTLLQGLGALRFPKTMLMILSFMVRYLFVAADQAMLMERARSSRFCGSGRLATLRVRSGMIGVLFVRSYERAERVYRSMVCRGFDGDARGMTRLRFAVADGLFAILFLGGLVAARWAGGA